MAGDTHPILLFDGVCKLCHGAVRFVLDHDRDVHFRFAPLQSGVGRALLERFHLDPSALDSIVLIDAAGAHARSDAALHSARALGAPWSWLWLLIAIPRPLRDAAYDFVAGHRYRWFGTMHACPVPRPEWRERFLE
jgi:predicted DCC family thiol-disulfide oxidoreductase YuxK